MRKIAALAFADELADHARLGDLPEEGSIDGAASGASPGRATATRVSTWVSAWTLRHSTAPADDALETTARFIGALSTQVRFLREHLSANERDRAFEVRALLVAVSALPAIDPDGSLLQFAKNELGPPGRPGARL
jgi:uncharacterized heparinase superfamily protein